MKRLAIALGAIGLITTVNASAAFPTGAQPTEVNVPEDQGGFFLGASLLYWQPTVSGNNLDFTNTQFLGTNGISTYQQLDNVNPNYNLGFNVFAGYSFGNGNDVALAYLRLHSSDNSSTGINIPAHYAAINNSHTAANAASIAAAAVPGVSISPVPSPASFVSPFDTYQKGYGKAEVNLDQGDLTVGQYFNMGCSDQLRLLGGLRYAKLQRTFNSTYSQNNNVAGVTNLANGVTSSVVSSGFVTIPVPGIVPIVEQVPFSISQSNGVLQAQDNSDFKGIGPIIGLNNTYYLGYGFGFIAGLDTGLLVGNVEDDLNLTNYQAVMMIVPPTIAGVPVAGAVPSILPTGTENITNTHISSDNTRRVAPVVDAKLGLDYTYPFQKYGSLSLELGWNATHYWNAVDGLGGLASDAPVVGTDRFARQEQEVSVGYQGPYLTLTYRATPTA
jgi:hypothetical protein